jgi:hypothetical protein
MAIKRLVPEVVAEANAQGKSAAQTHKGKAPATVTLNDLKDMVLPLLEREGYYDPNP